jgi:NagD protein
MITDGRTVEAVFFDQNAELDELAWSELFRRRLVSQFEITHCATPVRRHVRAWAGSRAGDDRVDRVQRRTGVPNSCPDCPQRGKLRSHSTITRANSAAAARTTYRNVTSLPLIAHNWLVTADSEPILSYLTDMDGVLVHEDHLIPGADAFLTELTEREIPYLVLTNNSIRTPRDLQARLRRIGLDIPASSIWTSATATATFLNEQRPGGTAYVVGESGLTTALHEIGYVLTDSDPDYVVLGETRTYSFEAITTAIRLVERGARFIATNPDPTGPSREGVLPATGSVAALITRATGRDPYYVGKPNPLMMRSALRQIGAHSQSAVMIGDRMDTDVIAGLEAGMRTVLVTSGISTRASMEQFPYRPTLVIDSVADLVGRTENPFAA